LTELYVDIEGEDKKLPVGSCICFPPGSYQYIKAAKGGLIHDWMHLSADFKKIALKYGFIPGKVYTPYNDGFVTELMQSAELEKMNASEFSEDICEMKVSEIIARLVRADKNSHTENISPDVNSAFSEARALIHLEYRKPWEIEQMAELVHLSPSRFFSLYKSIFGISPKSDLLNVRMEHAKNMLVDGKLSVKEVSEMTGYTNIYHFIRSFKAHTGKTPGKYRKSNSI
jgi:AraC-like DNA-binding protein